MPRLLKIAGAIALAVPAQGAYVATLTPTTDNVLSAVVMHSSQGLPRTAGRSAMMVASLERFEITSPGSMTKAERLRSRYAGVAYEPEGGWSASEVADFSYDELQSSMREIASFTRGDVTTGGVIGFEPNGALVDIGVKSSAYVTLQEMALVKPDKPEHALEIGQSYEFAVISREDENGQLMLSRRRILFGEAWDKVTQLYADDAVVEAEVAAVNRGGAMMIVEGLRAFLPGSHFLAGQTPTDEFIGQRMQVKFLDVDKDSTRLVVSHRKAIVDSQISDLSVGSVLKGIVTAVKPYGAFVDIGGMSGLLHISQISCDHISDVEAIIPVGTAIKCMVISQDKGKGRVALSTKTLEQEPGDMIKNQGAVFENAESTAAAYQERIAAERKAREEAAQDVIFGLESVFAEPAVDASEEPSAPAPVEAGAVDEAQTDLPFEG